MKKYFLLFTSLALFFVMSNCSANLSKTGILIIAPVEYKTQDFLKIAAKQFGKEYDISQGLQDDWAEYCWDKGFAISDPLVTKEILSDFSTKANFDKIIFIIFKDANVTSQDLGTTVMVNPYAPYALNRIEHVRRRANIEARVVIMNNTGKLLKVFEESQTDSSMASELRANRGAFEGLCKNVSARLKENNK